MTGRCAAVAALLALAAVAALTASHAERGGADGGGPVEVTYVANEGFLIRAGGHLIAVDVFFEGATIDWCHVPSQETARLMREAGAPFDAIDLILVTHAHVDHLTPGLLLAHLARNPRAVVVAPPQAVTKLRADAAWSAAVEARVREVDLPLFGSREITFTGIRVEAHRIRHGFYPIKDEATGVERDKHANVENLAYLVEAGGARLMHFGDALLKENGDYFDGKRFARRSIDVAFTEDGSDRGLGILKESLDPGTVVIMHTPADADRIERLRAFVSSRLPNAAVFSRVMESRSFPTRPAAPRP